MNDNGVNKDALTSPTIAGGSPESPKVLSTRNTILGCAALLLLALVANWIIFSTEPTAQRESSVRQSASLVDVIQGEFGTFRPIIQAMGTVRPAREITLSAQVEGDVLEMGKDFTPGGFVSEGELLVRLDDADYQIALQQSKGALEQAIATQEVEQGEQVSAREQYRQIGRELPPERQALVLREPQSRAARARVETAKADVRQAELNLERTTLEAPFDAHVVSRMVNTGSHVTRGTNLGRLVGMDTYWVEATVPVGQLQWLNIPSDESRQGSKVIVRNRQAWPKDTWREGTVYRLIGELEGNTRLARLLIAIEDPLSRNDASGQPRLIIGEFLNCRIEGQEIRDVVRIPRQYIREEDTVWIYDNGKLAIHPIEIRFQDEQYAYVRSGLSAADQIVTTRLSTVKEGLRLRIDGTDSVAQSDNSP